VDDRRSKRLAEDIADSVSGVTDVHNELRIS
jgi:osmotically-inducible protein OsmY